MSLELHALCTLLILPCGSQPQPYASLWPFLFCTGRVVVVDVEYPQQLPGAGAASAGGSDQHPLPAAGAPRPARSQQEKRFMLLGADRSVWPLQFLPHVQAPDQSGSEVPVALRVKGNAAGTHAHVWQKAALLEQEKRRAIMADEQQPRRSVQGQYTVVSATAGPAAAPSGRRRLTVLGWQDSGQYLPWYPVAQAGLGSFGALGPNASGGNPQGASTANGTNRRLGELPQLSAREEPRAVAPRENRLRMDDVSTVVFVADMCGRGPATTVEVRWAGCCSARPAPRLTGYAI